jgi:hypothetical protein
MTERSDLRNLRSLGEPRIHEWAGATEPISAGLVEWTRLAVGHDQRLAVRTALTVCEAITPTLGEPVSAYFEQMLAAIRAWLDDPSREHSEAVRSSLDVTRDRHAWQAEDADGAVLAQLWAREAVDHACLTVWAGERASYIVPLDFATTAGRVVACAYHAMRLAGRDETAAANAVIDVVMTATA